VSFKSGQSHGVGFRLDKEIVNLSTPLGIGDMRIFLEKAPWKEAEDIVNSGKHRIPLNQATIRAPIYNPEKIICVGLNYRDHAEESGMQIPSEPVIFSKFPSAIIGPGDKIIKPMETNELDYEVELVAVIGKKGRRISAKDAFAHIAGYTVGHDVSARDWQLKKTWRTMGDGEDIRHLCSHWTCYCHKYF